MNKFKKFIIAKILREPIYPPLKQPVVIRGEQRQVDSIGIRATTVIDTPYDQVLDTIANELAKRLITDGYVKVTDEPGVYPNTKIVNGRVEVVRRSEND